MAKPKLALIPAAQGSKFYSVLPSSGVGDFDFTRSGSATRINSQGLIETVGNGVSRLNYPLIDGKVVGCPSHLLEPSRTNLITYSENFSNSYWLKLNNVTVSAEKVISPDGTLNASQIIFDGTVNGRIEKGISGLTQGADYTVSVYARVSSGTQVVNFGSVSDFEYTLTTEWQRLTSTQAENDTVGYPRLKCNDASTIEIYGFQLEQSSFPTSYIPTNGSTVTRSAETANNSGDASTFNDSEGVLMVEISGFNETVSANNWISLTDGTTNQNNYVSIQQDTSGNIISRVRVNGVNSAVLYSTIIDQSLSSKIAIKYKLNDFSLYVNGFEYDSDNVGSIFSTNTLSKLSFDYNSLSNPFYGNTKQVQYYDSALTDSDLETLTSWVSFSDMANGQLYTIQ